MICLSCDKNKAPEGLYFCQCCALESARATYAITGWRDRNRFGVDDTGAIYAYDTEPLPSL